MTPEQIRDIVKAHAAKVMDLCERGEAIPQAIELSNGPAMLIVVGEIAAQLAELNNRINLLIPKPIIKKL